MDKLDPKALAECADDELNERDEVQPVTEMMIREYVIASGMLPRESAEPFADYCYQVWNDYNEEGSHNNHDVIEGVLAYWRGNA